MKTRTLLKTTALATLTLLFTSLLTIAQIPIQGLVANHEGGAAWDADGTGPEPAGYGHIHPFGWGSSLYYAASLDYDNIDPDPDAALAHFLDDINGFPLFEQALANHGFSPGQVKIKFGLTSEKNDIEGEDWFTIGDMHYLNKYDGYFYLELDGEAMVSGFIKNYFFTYNNSVYNDWPFKSNFTRPFNTSSGSSIQVQEVAEAFMQDMQSEELRIVIEHMQSSGQFFSTNGRDGAKFDILSGYLEKGFPELPFTGFEADQEGLAAWNADGTGPEPQAYGHAFIWGGDQYHIPYYFASRDYDDIDPDPGAGLCHFTGIPDGFPNLLVQLEYRGYTLDQLRLKSGLGTLGDDIEGIDWHQDGDIHYWNSYGNSITCEIDDEPIIEYVMDTNFNNMNMNEDYFNTQSSFSVPVNISSNSSSNAQHVAASFLKDLAGHSIMSNIEWNFGSTFPDSNGRIGGSFYELSSGWLEAKLPQGTHIWGGNVSGTWYLAGSPYIVMGYLKIPDGETLTIEPGVVVKFNTTDRFDIQGCLHAEGTEELPILFTAYDPDVRWGGMVWDQTPATNLVTVIRHCIFEYSYAYGTEPGYNCGGAIRINMVENIEIDHCLFRYNLVDNFVPGANPAGGAIILFESSIHISHCIFHDNAGSWAGAIAICTNSNPVVDNCLFYDNKSTYHSGGGGAGISWVNSSPYFVNCTFADNHAADAGGAFELEFGGTTTFTNCIFWGNTADIGAGQISVFDPDSAADLNIYYCDVEDGLNGIQPDFQGEYIENMDVDPAFITAGEYPYVPDTSYYNPSPCIDKGTENALFLPADYVFPLYCLCGNPRINGPVDMGCYESPLIVGFGRSVESDKATIKVYPNPSSGISEISYFLAADCLLSTVDLRVYDLKGKEIATLVNEKQQPGEYTIHFDASDLPAGIYLVRLLIGERNETAKLVVFR
jgi:hypothetical protein